MECSGVKDNELNMVRMPDMTTGLLRKDMNFIDRGINMSNRAKKTNTEAKMTKALLTAEEKTA